MKPIQNLVLSGGGLRGYCYLSLIKIIEESPELFDIKKIAGTSVGSIFALFIASKIKYQELYDKLLEKNTNDFQHIKLENIIKFLEKFGLDDGEPVTQFVAYFISSKYKNIHITFKQLYHITGIDLYITGTCLNTKKPVYFSHLNYPNMSVLLAIRISISIPFYFIPIYFENKLYVDGGVMDNFPIQLFENELENTWGINLLDNRIINDNVANFEDYAYSIYFANNNTRDTEKVEQYKPYCLNIPLTDVGVYSSSLSIETRTEWESIAYNLLKIYINKRIQTPPPTYKEYINQLEGINKDVDIDCELNVKTLVKLKKEIHDDICSKIGLIIDNTINDKINKFKNNQLKKDNTKSD